MTMNRKQISEKYEAMNEAERETYMNAIVETREITISIRGNGKSKRTMKAPLTQYDLDVMNAEIAERDERIARGETPSSVRFPLSCWQVRESQVIMRFRTGNKNHLGGVTAWLQLDGTVQCNEYNTVHNRHARIVGWADQLDAMWTHNSGWTGAAK